MYDNDVFEVVLYDRYRNETYRTKIATFSRMTDFIAERAVDGTRDWFAEIRGQHGQNETVDIQSLRLRAFRDGYLINV